VSDETSGTPGPVLLQGGAEMQPGCEEMDVAFLGLAPDGPLVLLLGAATPGPDHSRTRKRARRYYDGLGTGRTVSVAPHPEDDLEESAAAVAAASVVVLPGGSPSRLLDGLRLDGGRLAGALVEAHRRGAGLSGSSAGAMVLCARAALPDRGGSGGPVVEDGLALVPGLALVHDRGTGQGGWSDPDDPDGLRWGLPEQGGLLVHGGVLRAVGAGPVRVLRRGSAGVVPVAPETLDTLLPC